MLFEEEYRKIIEQLKKNEDYAVMRTICEDIIDLLKENGVKVDGVVLRDITSTKTMRVVDNFEVQLNGLDFTEHDKKYIDEIIDLQKRISELESELKIKGDANEALKCIVEEQRKEISRLTTEKDKIREENTDLKIDIARVERGLEAQSISGKFILEKLKNTPFVEDVLEEEPLPFFDEDYEESVIEELEERHQQDCITINQLHVTIDTLVDRYAKLREMRGV